MIQTIDLSFGSICWSLDSNTIYSTAVHRGVNRIFKLSLSGIISSMEEMISSETTLTSNINIDDKPFIYVNSLTTMHGNKSYSEPRIVQIGSCQYLYYFQSSFSSPNELMRLQLNDSTRSSIGNTVFAPLNEYDIVAYKDLSDCIDPYQSKLRAQYVCCPCPEYSNGDIATPTVSEHYFKGSKGEMVHAFYLPPVSSPNSNNTISSPPLGDATVPLLLIVHGGPQGAIINAWNFRWNMSIFAAQGYGVLAVNFHGSVGYGQEYTDSIRGDWGGGPYQDCLLGVDYILSQHRYLGIIN